MGEHEKLGSNSISTKSKCKSMRLVVKNNSGEISRLCSMWEKEKKDLERACRNMQSQLYAEKVSYLL
jgi:hypothetical protein